VLGPRPAEDDQVAVDGKERRHRQGVGIVRAYTVQGGRGLGAERGAPGSNEIPAAQAWRRRAPIEGMRVRADALPPQAGTARIIVQERGADYRMTVKGKQPTVADNLRQLQAGLTRAFSPSV